MDRLKLATKRIDVPSYQIELLWTHYVKAPLKTTPHRHSISFFQLAVYVALAHSVSICMAVNELSTYQFFFLRDFIFKKTLFEKLQYLKQKQ